MKLNNRVAVITGAGSGIGRATALSMARRGCHLALADINEDAVQDSARAAQALGVRASAHRLDVADRAAVAAFPEQVRRVHQRVDIVMNNAGVALGGSFEQVSEADFDWLLEINFNGVVRMTRAFLPLLHQSDDARIVNVSSIYGIIAPPGQAAYAASKFAVRGFSNVLRHELEGSTVGISVVHPGGVATSIAKNARIPQGAPADEVERGRKTMEKLLRMAPEQAGEIIVRGIEKRQARILVGSDAKAAAFLERLAPVGYWKLLKKAIKR
ncbi:acetoin dehydrogenase [Massilia sp. WF1]|uniref:SDR family NAD(P)-dependent oxidoreductase n=1 Tax=unclassified Massilia TaxID=2609279 RepID=UPI0006494EF3|nr:MULTISPECIES: SDR family NAD(P)-dependent oxidoreductase [unclassified Massilia]ALK97427.1 acetoin dehydrogenase [Massilia sp. WG5]KLU36608.1 acetoin dehydrogenase [Massilia sp. WF1]